MLLVIVPVFTAAASPDLVAFKDKPFCERVFELFQKNLGGGNRLNTWCLTVQPGQMGTDCDSWCGSENAVLFDLG